MEQKGVNVGNSGRARVLSSQGGKRKGCNRRRATTSQAFKVECLSLGPDLSFEGLLSRSVSDGAGVGARSLWA